MIKDFVDDQWIFDAGNNFHSCAATTAGRDIDLKHAFKSLRPGHFPMFICRRLCAICTLQALSTTTLATLRRRHIDSVLTVGGKNAVIACQIGAGSGYQCGQNASDEDYYTAVSPTNDVNVKMLGRERMFGATFQYNWE